MTPLKLNDHKAILYKSFEPDSEHEPADFLKSVLCLKHLQKLFIHLYFFFF